MGRQKRGWRVAGDDEEDEEGDGEDYTTMRTAVSSTTAKGCIL